MYIFKSLAPNNLVVDWMWSVRENKNDSDQVEMWN